MKILGIDTTTRFLCLGICDDARIYEYNMDLGIKHSALLVPTIKRALEALGWQLGDIDYFACGLGPGSFTGIRVGLSTIKGLSWALKKPIVGISTLDILACNASGIGGAVVPAIDAKRNLIYCSIYQFKNGALKRTAPYMLLQEAELLKKIPAHAVLLGDAAAKIEGARILDKDSWYPKARHIISLALERIKEKKFKRAFSAQPIYLYPKECQIKKSPKS